MGDGREATVGEYMSADEVVTCENSVVVEEGSIAVRICCTRKRSYQPLQGLLLLLLARRGVGAATIDVLLFLLSWLQDLQKGKSVMAKLSRSLRTYLERAQ